MLGQPVRGPQTVSNGARIVGCVGANCDSNVARTGAQPSIAGFTGGACHTPELSLLTGNRLHRPRVSEPEMKFV